MQFLEFNEWLLDQYLLEMVRAASPEESADWLKLFLQRASKSTSDWKRINAPYWLQSDNFNRLLSQILLNKINVFNTDFPTVKNNIEKLMVNDLQKDVGFGSRRNMAYAKSLEKEPEVALHPAYGTNVAYKRPIGGWKDEISARRLGSKHREDSKQKTSDTMKQKYIAINKNLINANLDAFNSLKKMYAQQLGPDASEVSIAAAALKDMKKRFGLNTGAKTKWHSS